MNCTTGAFSFRVSMRPLFHLWESRSLLDRNGWYCSLRFSAVEWNSKGAVYQSGGVILSMCCAIVAREVVSGWWAPFRICESLMSPNRYRRSGCLSGVGVCRDFWICTAWSGDERASLSCCRRVLFEGLIGDGVCVVVFDHLQASKAGGWHYSTSCDICLWGSMRLVASDNHRNRVVWVDALLVRSHFAVSKQQWS